MTPRLRKALFETLYRNKYLYRFASTVPFAGQWRAWQRQALPRLRGHDVLELGCGLGLPALTAAMRGAEVLATDWAEEAIELLRRNAERNGVFLRVARVRWSEPEPLLGAAPWDLVLGADLLYEARNAEQLAELLPQLGGEVLLAEPGRPYAKEFLERFAADDLGELIYRIA